VQLKRGAAFAVATVLFSGLLSTASPAGEAPRCFGRSATIAGTNGHDSLRGTSGPDVIVGRRGYDAIFGCGGNDLICGGTGADGIEGGAGRDKIRAGPDPGDELVEAQARTSFSAAQALTGSLAVAATI
jgi:Ca2+-binding RTX toxin-like protein